MAESISWAEKYQLALNEQLTVKQIMLLRTIGQPRAQEIRKKVLDYCYTNDIEAFGKRVPTEIVFLITGYDLDYYYQKMMKEAELLNVRK